MFPLKKHILFFIFLGLCARLSYSANDIYFSKVGIEQGLSQLSVVTIYQDELGRMWFGTREGANLYTGNSIRTFLPVPDDHNSLQSNLISTIVGDKNGTVYIHSHKGINKYDMVASRMTLVERGNFETVAFADGKLWAAVGSTLYSYENNVKQKYVEIPGNNTKIKRILIAWDGRIFLGTLSAVYVVDKNRKVREVLKNCSQVSRIYEDSKKNIWIGTWEHGLFRLDIEGNVTNYRASGGNSLSADFVRDICEDNQGYFWIGTRKGLDRLTVESSSFKHYDPSEFGFQRLSNESVWVLYKDKQGTIWVGTYHGGVNYFNPEVNYFTYHDLQKGSFINKPFPIISDIAEADNGHLLLSTEGNGLIDYNPQDRTYVNYTRSDENPNSLSADNIKTAYLDKDKQQLWLGMHLGGITLFDIPSKRFTRYENIKPEWEQSNIVRAIVPYQGNLLVATYNGLFSFNPSIGKFTLFSENLHKAVQYFVDIKPDNKNNLWIAGNDLVKYNLGNGNYVRYTHIPQDKNSISDNNPTKILIDSKNRIWVGTNGKGVNLYNEKTDNFTRYNSSNSDLRNDFISNLKESKNGYIVITTTKGFSMLDPESGKIYNYGKENGMPLNSLYNGGMALTKNGELYLAGMNGMVSFFEERLTVTPKELSIHFVGLWVNNKLVQPDDKSGILKKSLAYTNALKLSHKQSVITIEFAADNFVPGNQQSYRYRLLGSSDEWNELPPGVTKLNFLQLNSGKYKLELEAFSPTDGNVNATTSLSIRINPPFYRSWLAYLLYLALLSVIIWRILEFSQSQLLLKTSLEYEKKEKENIEAANQSKLRFFTNISHEFRTPLTLIAGQVDMLMQSHNVPPSIYNRILSIKRNTQNMQGLITELLEFRKSEQGHLSIKVGEHDFIHFLYEIFFSFQDHAKYRQIDFFFDCKEEKIMLWFDPMQMQKVFYNLISNAFKYTPQQGKIVLSVEDESDYVVVKVTDSGIGIKPEEISKVFDRFYQAEHGLNITNVTPGTGIGLALTKNILELHEAQITVNSQPEAGSQFVVKLKKGSSHFREEQKEILPGASKEYENQLADLDDEFMNRFVETNAEGKKEYTMLIVEDNEELAQMLKQIFEAIYNVEMAYDGEEGLEKTLELMPDIVLSDLMMPKMSGSEMCSKIKSNFIVSHIPVVLLTAQTAVEYNLEGLRLGADDYITKPFNVKVLITRCNNLINGRKLLQEKFSKQTEFSPHLLATNKLDQEFLEKANRVIEDNLDNPDFDVEMFSREMALGRTKLFGKLKGVSGQTPNEFIINLKMKKASKLLLEHLEYNISDIAYMLGFNTPKYFAKCFRDQFGVTPTEYRKAVEKEA